MPKVSAPPADAARATRDRGARSRRLAGACGALALGGLACGPHSATTAPPATAPTASASAAPPGAGPAGSARPTMPAAAPAPPVSAGPPPPPPPNAGSTKVTTRHDPAWASCRAGVDVTKKDVSRGVEALGAACAKATGMKLVGKTRTGAQSDQDPPQTFPLKAAASHCYRVYAIGSEGIRDLDLALKDSTGALAGEDATDGPNPAVLEDGAICFKEDDSATVVVSVGLGKGTYAVAIWSD